MTAAQPCQDEEARLEFTTPFGRNNQSLTVKINRQSNHLKPAQTSTYGWGEDGGRAGGARGCGGVVVGGDNG